MCCFMWETSYVSNRRSNSSVPLLVSYVLILVTVIEYLFPKSHLLFTFLCRWLSKFLGIQLVLNKCLIMFSKINLFSPQKSKEVGHRLRLSSGIFPFLINRGSAADVPRGLLGRSFSFYEVNYYDLSSLYSQKHNKQKLKQVISIKSAGMHSFPGDWPLEHTFSFSDIVLLR